MLQRKIALLSLVIAMLVCAGCVTTTETHKIRNLEKLSREYDVRDNAATRERLKHQEKLGLAANRLQAGRLDEAEKLARGVLGEKSLAADAYTLLAVIAAQRGDNAQAGEHYRKALDLAPQQGAMLNNYGAWLCANGHAAEGIVLFDRALQDPRYPSPASALANAGGCALQAGQGERAERDLRKALELDPANAYALESMARNEVAHRRYFEARAFSQRRLAAAPATPSVLQLAIQIELGLGDKAAASRYQQRLDKDFPEDATANPGAKAL